jgi:hypothetical protein
MVLIIILRLLRNMELPEDEHAPVIMCTADPKKLDGKTCSKWSRAGSVLNPPPVLLCGTLGTGPAPGQPKRQGPVALAGPGGGCPEGDDSNRCCYGGARDAPKNWRSRARKRVGWRLTMFNLGGPVISGPLSLRRYRESVNGGVRRLPSHGRAAAAWGKGWIHGLATQFVWVNSRAFLHTLLVAVEAATGTAGPRAAAGRTFPDQKADGEG